MNNFEDTRKKFRWVSLIVGLIFVALSIWAFMHPGKAAFAMVWILVIGMLIGGIVDFFIWNDIGKSGLTRPSLLLVDGILDIILAILIIIMSVQGSSNGTELPNPTILIIGYMFAFSFIFESITSMSVASLSYHPTANTILGVIGLILGILLLFNPVLGTAAAVFMIAIYLLIFGILLIARAF